MAQGDYLIQNQSFPSFRSDLNSTLEAINTSNSGTSRPTSAVAGTIWLDTTNSTNPTLKLFDGTDDISLATFDYSANTVNWLDSTVSFDIVNDLSPQLGAMLDVNGNAIGNGTEELIKFSETASAVNEVTVTNSATGNAPEISATGDDTNIDFKLTPKGTGKLVLDGLNFPTSDGTADQVLKTDGSGNLSFTDVSGGTNTPAFEAYLGGSGGQSVSDNAVTLVQANTEVYDTDSAYDTSTYRFTPQVAGKYLVYGSIQNESNSATNLKASYLYFKKNGSNILETSNSYDNNPIRLDIITGDMIVDMNGSTDYVELYGRIDSISGSGQLFESDTQFKRATHFGAYKIIE